MLKLTINEILKAIENEEKVDCISCDGGFSLVIEEYAPFICAAIHNGSNLRDELDDKIALSKKERWYEEDPHTADFISSLPIKVIGNDSRYEYDLNRVSSECIYEEAWGKKVWNSTLTAEERNTSIKKHENFYKVIDKLVEVIERKYNCCVVYDIHSYNYKRMEGNPPMFNVGTTKIKKKFKLAIDDWLKRLNSIDSDFIDTIAKENDVFFGRGNFLNHISKKHKKTLVLATEVKKQYCDELTGEIYPEVIQDIKEGFKVAIVENAKFFVNKNANVSIKKKYSLLGSHVDPILMKVDRSIYRKLKKFEVLNFVNPKNLDVEKKRFFSSKFKRNPSFKYKPLNLSSNDLKSDLFGLPISKINDVSVQSLYYDVINYYCDEMEMLAHRGSDQFLYMSLKNFDRPTQDEINKAKYFLKSPDIFESTSRVLNDEEILDSFKKVIKDYKLNGKVEMAKNMPSQAVFIPPKNLLRIRKGMITTEKQMVGLGHHEVGIHMLTTENSLEQPLKIFQLGLPMNVMTQEGLAIYNEYLCGSFNIKRLKELSLRVLAVDHMIRVSDFKQTFLFLRDDYQVDEDAAFYLTVRVYRGGGFTKDHLYFRGFHEIKALHESGKKLDNLLIGKTSHQYLEIIDELISRGLAKKPKNTVSLYTDNLRKEDKVLDYLISALESRFVDS